MNNQQKVSPSNYGMSEELSDLSLPPGSGRLTFQTPNYDENSEYVPFYRNYYSAGVTNFRFGLTWQDLYSEFKPFGAARVMMKSNGPPSTLAYVLFPNYEDYLNFVNDVDEAELHGRTIHVFDANKNGKVDENYLKNSGISISVKEDGKRELKMENVERRRTSSSSSGTTQSPTQLHHIPDHFAPISPKTKPISDSNNKHLQMMGKGEQKKSMSKYENVTQDLHHKPRQFAPNSSTQKPSVQRNLNLKGKCSTENITQGVLKMGLTENVGTRQEVSTANNQKVPSTNFSHSKVSDDLSLQQQAMKTSAVEQVVNDCCPGTRPICVSDLPEPLPAVVTYVVSDNLFWAQLIIDPEEQQSLASVQQNMMSPDSSMIQPFEGVEEECDRRIAALYMGEWSRAWFINQEREGAQVLFVDYGNIEVISMTDIRKTSDDVWCFRPLATPCRYSGTEAVDLNTQVNELAHFQLSARNKPNAVRLEIEKFHPC